MRYVGYYHSIDAEGHERKFPVAAIEKMLYISRKLSEKGYPVEMFSLCGRSCAGYLPSKKYKISEGIDLRYVPSLGRGSKLRNALDISLRLLSLFLYLLSVKKGDVVIVYHSLGYFGVVNLAKKLRGFNLVLEVEEIYADVVNASVASKLFERNLISLADGFIFPTKLLDNVNYNNKRRVIIHGSYSDKKLSKKSITDAAKEVVDVVYAGTLDARKGVVTFIRSSEHLPSFYRLHVLGFGSYEEVSAVKDAIGASSNNESKVIYHGLMLGDDYDSFLCSCDIGVSPQSFTAKFNDTSFPSKILSYISHGLKVVSVRIRSIEESYLKNEITFYDGDDPKSLADAIIEAGSSLGEDGKSIIEELDEKFESDIGLLISSFHD